MRRSGVHLPHPRPVASKERAEEEASAAAKTRVACLGGPLGGGVDGKELLCLISRGCGHNRRQSSYQSRVVGWLASRGVPHAVVDGTDPDARDLRERLFAISGTRGGYPQFFIVTSMSSSGDGGGNGNGGGGGEGDGGRRVIIEYFGDFNRMEMLNETSGLPPEVLATHPELMTWEDIHFGTTADRDRRPRWRRRGRGGRRRSHGRSRPDGGAGIRRHLHGSDDRNRGNDRD